ncbi:MAG: glycosyl hydrolase family 28-related protein [Gammaproteobacteria bacterium]
MNGRPQVAASPNPIPSISWIPRSDWINVKTDIHPPAQGDGTTDDTAALQSALSRIGPSPGDPKVVYLPAGTYRVTRTLVLRRRIGGMLVGHGRDTVLLWDGRRAGRMYWSDGAAYQSYLGLVWDGAGKAAVGIDHDSKTLYETRVLHEYMEFRNFAEAGIRVGHDQKVASAEMLFSNLSFRGNRNAVEFLSWNDYNNIFDGCEFAENDRAIHCEKGNVVVRNTRFESNRDCDLFLCPHSHSIRRCVSVGSGAFIRTVRGPMANCAVRVEDCRIDGWRDHEGAIVPALRGPILVFDTTFTNPPGRLPPIRLDNPRYMGQIAILSNVTSPGTPSVIDGGHNGTVRWIPQGPRTAPRTSYPTGSRILDVKTDFGAKGDGSSDDTLALQRALNAAHRLGSGTILYLPSGSYNVSRTLQVQPGAEYSVEGTGWHSQIVLADPRVTTTVHIDSPNGLKITRLGVGGPAGTTTILHTARGASRAEYHNVFGYQRSEKQDVQIIFDSLPAGSLVLTGHLDGPLVVRNSSQATILIGFLASLMMTVEGTSPQSGFLGILSHVSANRQYPLIVRDNQSLVITDWYNEQTRHIGLVQGRGGAPHSRVVIDHTEAASTAPVFLEVDKYQGLVAELGGIFGFGFAPPWNQPHVVTTRGGSNLTLVFIGNIFWFNQPRIEGPVSRAVWLGNSISGKFMQQNTVVPDRYSKSDSALCAAVLESFQILGAKDLVLNYDYTSP